jgi:hypothetical protein
VECVEAAVGAWSCLGRAGVSWNILHRWGRADDNSYGLVREEADDWRSAIMACGFYISS